MEPLKLTSIRLDRQSLEQADKIAKCRQCYHQSDVLRLAIWAGLKIVNANNLYRLSRLQWDEEYHGVHHELEDVLRTAAQNKEGAR